MLVIWEKPNNEVYFRNVSGWYSNYEVGYCNQYNHKVILVIKGYIPYTREKFSKKLARKLISFLNKV